MFRLFFLMVILLALTGSIIAVKQITTHKQPVAVEQTFPPGLSQDLQSPLALASPSPNQQGTNSPVPSSSKTSANTSALTAQIADLQHRVGILEQKSSATKTPLYIPLGSNGATELLDWQNLPTFSATINPADYIGYKSMQLEVSMRVYQGNGEALARLIDSNEQIVIAGSDVSTTSENYSWVSSSGFTIFPDTKTYIVQLKTTTGYEAGIQSARIKVNY